MSDASVAALGEERAVGAETWLEVETSAGT